MVNIGRMKPGDLFGWDTAEYMVVDKKMSDLLLKAGLISRSPGRDWDLDLIGAVSLDNRRDVGFALNVVVEPLHRTDMKHWLVALALRKELRCNGIWLPGATVRYEDLTRTEGAAATVRHSSAEPNLAQLAKAATPEEMTLSEALYRDRLAVAKALPTCVPMKPALPVVDPMTKGDRAIEAARQNTLMHADTAIVALRSAQELFRKFGMDAELTEALNNGLKGLESFIRLRKRGRS